MINHNQVFPVAQPNKTLRPQVGSAEAWGISENMARLSVSGDGNSELLSFWQFSQRARFRLPIF